MLTDPDGHFPFLAITAAIGAVAGAVIGGIRAAKSGKSVWKGALKGAAIGGLIGLGAGAAAGVALAGSVTASTAAVITGAKAAVATTAAAIGTTVATAKDKIAQGTQKVFNAVDNVPSKMPGSVSAPISNDIVNLPRAGSALKLDPYHAFPDIVDNYAGLATKSSISNGTLYQLKGALNGTAGSFEWIVQNQEVTHRMFVSGGEINGIPIMP